MLSGLGWSCQVSVPIFQNVGFYHQPMKWHRFAMPNFRFGIFNNFRLFFLAHWAILGLGILFELFLDSSWTEKG